MVKTMNREEMIQELGLIGEKIMLNHFSSQGRKIIHSLDKFDNKKDMIVDDKTIEVKTKIPFILKKSLSIAHNQLKKCRTVDEFYFITVPHNKYYYEWSGWIFKVNSDFKTINYITDYDVNMLLIPIQQSAVSPIKQLEDFEIKELVKYTTSDY